MSTGMIKTTKVKKLLMQDQGLNTPEPKLSSIDQCFVIFQIWLPRSRCQRLPRQTQLMIPSYQKLRPILDSATTTSKRKSSRSSPRIAEKYCSNQLELLMILQEKPRTLKGAMGTEVDSAAGLALSGVVWRTACDGSGVGAGMVDWTVIRSLVPRILKSGPGYSSYAPSQGSTCVNVPTYT
jgi:hypothetical protein